jgi:hypothetical protein
MIVSAKQAANRVGSHCLGKCHMTRYPSWMTGAVALLAVVSEAAPLAAVEGTMSYPQVIICEVRGAQHFGYLNVINADGSAVYMSLDRLAVTVSPDGMVTGLTAEVRGNCAGKTLDELVANGQTRDFASAPFSEAPK